MTEKPLGVLPILDGLFQRALRRLMAETLPVLRRLILDSFAEQAKEIERLQRELKEAHAVHAEQYEAHRAEAERAEDRVKELDGMTAEARREALLWVRDKIRSDFSHRMEPTIGREWLDEKLSHDWLRLIADFDSDNPPIAFRVAELERERAKAQAALEIWFPLGDKLIELAGNRWGDTPDEALERLRRHIEELDP